MPNTLQVSFNLFPIIVTIIVNFKTNTNLLIFIMTLKIASYSFFFFFLELGTEPRALRLLGKCSTTELNPQPRLLFLNSDPHLQ